MSFAQPPAQPQNIVLPQAPTPPQQMSQIPPTGGKPNVKASQPTMVSQALAAQAGNLGGRSLIGGAPTPLGA